MQYMLPEGFDSGVGRVRDLNESLPGYYGSLAVMVNKIREYNARLERATGVGFTSKWNVSKLIFRVTTILWTHYCIVGGDLPFPSSFFNGHINYCIVIASNFAKKKDCT